MQGQFQSVFQHPADPGVELLRSLWERPRSRNPPVDGGDRGLHGRGLDVLLWIAWSGGIGVIAPGYRHTLKEGPTRGTGAVMPPLPLPSFFWMHFRGRRAPLSSR